MTKRQLIDEIRRYNASAASEFLEQFDETSLTQYLQRLQGADKRGLSIHTTATQPEKLRMVS